MGVARVRRRATRPPTGGAGVEDPPSGAGSRSPPFARPADVKCLRRPRALARSTNTSPFRRGPAFFAEADDPELRRGGVLRRRDGRRREAGGSGHRGGDAVYRSLASVAPEPRVRNALASSWHSRAPAERVPSSHGTLRVLPRRSRSHRRAVRWVWSQVRTCHRTDRRPMGSEETVEGRMSRTRSTLILAVALCTFVGCHRRACNRPILDETSGSAETRDGRPGSYRWIASERPSFDPVTGGQVVGTGRIGADSTFRVPLPRALATPCFIAVEVWSSKLGGWAHVGHDWIWEEPDRVEVEDSAFPSDPGAATQYLHCVVLTVRGIQREPGEISVEDRSLPGASLVLMPYEWGTPPPNARVLRSDSHGTVQAGPLVGKEWYADVSAAGHCSARVLVPVGPQGDEPEVAVHLFPSRRRVGRVTVDGMPPPKGAFLKVTPEAVRGVVVGTYFPIQADGTFAVDEPVLGDCTYAVELPDGRKRVVAKSQVDSDLMIDIR